MNTPEFLAKTKTNWFIRLSNLTNSQIKELEVVDDEIELTGSEDCFGYLDGMADFWWLTDDQGECNNFASEAIEVVDFKEVVKCLELLESY